MKFLLFDFEFKEGIMAANGEPMTAFSIDNFNKGKLNNINFENFNKELLHIEGIKKEIENGNTNNMNMLSRYVLSVENLLNKILKDYFIDSEIKYKIERRQYLDKLSKYEKIVKNHLLVNENQKIETRETCKIIQQSLFHRSRLNLK